MCAAVLSQAPGAEADAINLGQKVPLQTPESAASPEGDEKTLPEWSEKVAHGILTGAGRWDISLGSVSFKDSTAVGTLLSSLDTFLDDSISNGQKVVELNRISHISMFIDTDYKLCINLLYIYLKR